MNLFFVGDGKRDARAVPRIVEKVLGNSVQETFIAWKDLPVHRGSGFGRKLQMALLRARDTGCKSVVATVDRDKDQKRLRLEEMQAVRKEDRDNVGNVRISVALGEADPHLEAWLIDDQNTVKSVLGIAAEKSIATPTQGDPKGELDKLIEDCGRSETHKEIFGEILLKFDFSHCTHSEKTGLAEFVEDVRQEFQNLSI